MHAQAHISPQARQQNLTRPNMAQLTANSTPRVIFGHPRTSNISAWQGHTLTSSQAAPSHCRSKSEFKRRSRGLPRTIYYRRNLGMQMCTHKNNEGPRPNVEMHGGAHQASARGQDQKQWECNRSFGMYLASWDALARSKSDLAQPSDLPAYRDKNICGWCLCGLPPNCLK